MNDRSLMTNPSHLPTSDPMILPLFFVAFPSWPSCLRGYLPFSCTAAAL
jgi:hypothetical protein